MSRGAENQIAIRTRRGADAMLVNHSASRSETLAVQCADTPRAEPEST
jgi:hypothetical protein